MSGGQVARRGLRKAEAELEAAARAAALADQRVYEAQRQVKRWQYATKHPEVAPFLRGER